MDAPRFAPHAGPRLVCRETWRTPLPDPEPFMLDSHSSTAPVQHGDLFTALHGINETTQSQIACFHRQMALVKALAGQLHGEAQLQLLGDVSISLHRVHAL